MAANEKRNGKKMMMKRILILMVAIVFLLSLDIFRVLYIQVVKGDEYSAKAQSQQLLDSEVSAMRGSIYDSEGNILAQSATVWTVYLDPQNINTDKKRNLIVDKFSEIFEYDDEERKELIEKTKNENRYTIVEKQVENNIKEDISAFVSENKLGQCVGMEQSTKRYYPYGSMASSVIGFTGSDDQGLYGLESYYDEELTGVNGRVISAKDAKSNIIADDYATSVAAKDGNSLVLTINQTMQHYLEKGLRQTMEEYQSKGAYGIVMDCKTGGILAMSSLPDFDCNDPFTMTYKKNIKAVEKAKGDEKKKEAESAAIINQQRNFTVSDTYVPGSVFKSFIAAAALEEGVVNLKTGFNCSGSIKVETHTMNCHFRPGHGSQTLTQGLENSCNPFFITIGQRLGVHNYFKYFDAFGFTEKTGIDLPGEASSQYYEENQYSIVELSSAAFGQTNSLTPIQMCTGLSAIANGGTLVKPHLVSEVVDPSGKTVSKTETTEVRQVISKETSAKVCKMMKSVVDNGTGKNAYVAGYSVGGKTGTSTKLGESKPGEKDKYIVSFAALAPADDPEIVMLIIIDEPNEDLGGGALCAPIAALVIEEAMSQLNIEPKYNEKELKQLSYAVPAVSGISVDKAKSTLKDHVLTYKVIGDGDKVLRQSPSAKTPIPSGGCVYLYTESSKKKTVKVPNFSGLTVSEAKSLAASNKLNIELSGNELASNKVKAYRQSEEVDKEVEQGTVITVSFKNKDATMD